MHRRDWTLLAIASGDAAVTQPVQLQKALFLLGEKLTPDHLGTEAFYEFTPYDYGPFSKAVYSDAEALEAEGLVAIRRPPDTRFNLYVATLAGQQRAAELRGGLSPEASEYLDRLMSWVRSLSFQELVKAIYQSFPEMKANSVFQE
ncbi:MAG: hypothetical protein AMXMBFR53_41910 [Gemmatimonadota bacterium]